MKIVFTIQHPSHVHFFKNCIDILNKNGHSIHAFAREKDVNAKLLDLYNIQCEMLVGQSQSAFDLLRLQPLYEYRLLKATKQIQPDLFIAEAGVAAAHVSKILGCEYMLFANNEHATVENALSMPFATDIYIPESYNKNLKWEHTRYPSYYPLAYLHPNWFTPDPTVLTEAGVSPETKLVILRLVSWNAMHDIGQKGVTNIQQIVNQLESTGAEVVITAEDGVPEEVSEKKMTIPPDKFHHLLYYADLYIGEGAMTAAESALLGTPAIYINSLDLGYINELESRHGLVFQYGGQDAHQKALRKSTQILTDSNTSKWEERRKKLLAESVDVTNLLVEKINDYSS